MKCPRSTMRYQAPATCCDSLVGPRDARSNAECDAGPYTSTVFTEEAPPMGDGLRTAAWICFTNDGGNARLPAACLLPPPHAAHASTTKTTSPMRAKRFTSVFYVAAGGAAPAQRLGGV